MTTTPLRSINEVPAYTGDDGAHIHELAGRSTGLDSHSLALIIHPAGTAARRHHHTVADEIYHVVSGQGRLAVDQIEYALKPGDTVQIRPGQLHKVWNDGPEDLVLMVTCSPAYAVTEVVWDEE